MRAIRWGDNDHYFGPFTYAVSPTYRTWAIVLKSRGDDDVESGQCSLRLSAGSHSILIVLPHIIKPWREKVYPGPSSWGPEVVARLGRDWYWKIDPRQYGFSYGDGFLQIKYGRTTHDSSTDQSKGYFLPWTQWRHVRQSFYGLAGEHIATAPETISYILDGGQSWEIAREMQESCPKVVLAFEDFDGEHLTVTTHIEEREWRFGTGWFKWLSLFRKPKISRSLSLSFSGETGRRKGSWKGGTIGHSIEMLPGEMHGSAFKRYCQEHDMKFGT